MNVNPITKWCAICAASIGLLILGALMDGPDDIAAAQAVADDYAQATRDGGKAKCAALGRDPLWTKDGDLVCRERMHVAGGKR
jgi:hypothetical protein